MASTDPSAGMTLPSLYKQIQRGQSAAQILGLLKETVTATEIRTAYRNIVLKIHPDKARTKDLVDLHTSLFKKVQVAADDMLLRAETHAGRGHPSAPKKQEEDASTDVQAQGKAEKPSYGSSSNHQSRSPPKPKKPKPRRRQPKTGLTPKMEEQRTCTSSAFDATKTPEQSDDKLQMETGDESALPKPRADEMIDDWEAEEQRLEHVEDILVEKRPAAKKQKYTPTLEKQKPTAAFEVRLGSSTRQTKGKEAQQRKSKRTTGTKKPKAKAALTRALASNGKPALRLLDASPPEPMPWEARKEKTREAHSTKSRGPTASRRPRVKVAHEPALASNGKPALRLLDKSATPPEPMPWKPAKKKKKKGAEPWQRRAKPATASKKHKLALASNGNPALRLLDAPPPSPMPWERRKNGWRRVQEQKESQQRKPMPAIASKKHKLALASSGKPALRLLSAPPPSPKPWEPQPRHRKKPVEPTLQRTPRPAALYAECKPALASTGTPALALPAPPTGPEPRLWPRYVPRPKKKKTPLRGQRVRTAEPLPSAIVAFVRDEAMRELQALLKELASKKRKTMSPEQLKEVRAEVRRLCRVAGLTAPM